MTTEGAVSTAPGFANEKKVDHAGLVVEVSIHEGPLMIALDQGLLAS